MTRHLLAASFAALALAGCGDRNSATVGNTAAADNLSANENSADNIATAELAPTTPQGFADIVAASDDFEIESSRLAQQKATQADVKEFAAMLVADHTKSTEELKAAAAKLSPPVTPSPALDAEQQANMDALSKAGGTEFDRLYMRLQVPAHEKALLLLQNYAAGGEVAPFKDFSAEVAPVVQQHLEKARTLQR